MLIVNAPGPERAPDRTTRLNRRRSILPAYGHDASSRRHMLRRRIVYAIAALVLCLLLFELADILRLRH